MKSFFPTALLTLLFTLPSLSAEEPEMASFDTGKVNPFEDARRPITNPVYFDLTIPQTQIRPLFMYHNLPDKMNTTLNFYDPYGEGPLDALEDLKFKPSYFFGDYNYIIGVDQETDNARITKQFRAQQNLWYVEGAMCDIVDELVKRK